LNYLRLKAATGRCCLCFAALARAIALLIPVPEKNSPQLCDLKLKNIFAERILCMSDLLTSYEGILLKKLMSGDKSAFTIIFTKYYQSLVRFSYSFIHDVDAAEEIVQEVFYRLWENREHIAVSSSLKSYLLKSVQNRSLDSLRHTDVTGRYASFVLAHPILSHNDTENYVLFSELEDKLSSAMDKMPVQFSEAFRLSRFEKLSYEEISTRLGVSVRTIEVRISRALDLLRRELKDYLIALFWMWLTFFD